MPGHIVPIREHQEVPLYNPDHTIHSIITLAIHQEVILEETADLVPMEAAQRHVPVVEAADLFNVQIRVVEDKSN